MNEFSRGWKIVVTAIVGLGLGCRIIMIYGFGVFSPPMMREMGWSATQAQFSLTIVTICGILSIPLLGLASKRWHLRSIIIVSQVGMSAALLGFAVMPNSLPIFYGLSALVAVLGIGTLPMTWTKLVVLWFSKHRGFATGLALLGTGLGGSLLKPFTAALVRNFGWRGAFVGLAILPLVLAMPLAIAWARTPRSKADEDQLDIEQVGTSFAASLRDLRFWLLGLSMIPAGATVAALLVNSELILVKHGIAAGQVVSITMLTGLFVIFGRISGGFLLDRMNPALLGAILVLALLISCLLLTTDPISHGRGVAAVALLGTATGVELDVISILCARIFGLKDYVQIYGAALILFLVGDALGPVGFSYVTGHSGNPNVALEIAAAMLLASSAMMVTLAIRTR